MRQIKSERLKKLEQELTDLEQWLKLGLVPKKDIQRHKEEIVTITAKIEEEKERLQFLKESGEGEEYVTPKRQAARAAYTELPTIPDIDLGETAAGVHDTTFDVDSDATETDMSDDEDRTESEDKDDSDEDEDDAEEESFFSERNRWRRGFKDIIDPDANEW